MRSIPSKISLLIIFFFIQVQASTPVNIAIDRDGIQLKGKFYLSEGTGVFPTVILLHGFPGGEGDVLGIGKTLSDVGINVLSFNYSGTHKSEGAFNFNNSQKDIKAAYDFICHSENIIQFKIDTTRIILGGYSYGGGMALTYAANHPEINEIFSIAGNDHGAFMREYCRNPVMQKEIDKMFDELKAQTEKVRFGPGGTVKEISGMKIIETNPTYDLRKCAPLLAQNRILLIAGWDDPNVSVENIVLPLYRELQKENAKDIEIVGFQDNHSFKNSRDELANTIIEWIKEKLISSDISINRNGVLLNGKFFIPEGSGPFPTVIFLKGFYEPQDDYLDMRKLLSQAGFTVLTFQYSGTDQSQGEFSFKNTQQDIQAAFQFIHHPENIAQYKIDTTRIHLGGLSYGGSMALTYAAGHPEIKSVFSIAGTGHVDFIRDYQNNPNMKQWFDKWWKGLAAPEGPVRIEDGFSIKALIDMGIENYLPTLDVRRSVPLLAQKSILLIGGWDDTRTSFDNRILPLYRSLINEGAQNVRIAAVQDNHSFKNSYQEIVEIIIDWLRAVPKHVSTFENNKSMVKHFFNEVVGQGNINAVNSLLSTDCRYFDAGSIKTTNIQEFIVYLKKARLPFESINIKFDNIIAEGNHVAVRYSYHSVLDDKLMVVPAMADFLIEDGKIFEIWRYIPARKKKK